MHGSGPFSATGEPGGPDPQGSTLDFPHLLGLPGHDTAAVAGTPAVAGVAATGDAGATRPPPDPRDTGGTSEAGPASEATHGFGATLPLPHPPGFVPHRPAPSGPVDPLRAPGATLGRYRLGGLLGTRAGTTVFAATHPVHGECRVVVLDPEVAAARGAPFLLEARLLATVDDPALLPVLESGAEPRPWLAQPQLPGITLREALRREGPWSVDRAGELLRHLARALGRLHALGVTHGDLDPDQVLLTPGGPPRLTGCGTPVFVSHLGDRQPFPGGPSLPPALHAPPEVQAGARPDPRADVWGLGLLLFEVLTGRPAFSGDDPLEVQARIAKGPPPRETWPPLSPALAAILVRCLQKSPQARFGDAGQLLRALEPVVPAGSPGAPAGRGRSLLLLALGGLVLLSAALLLLLVSGR